jgi:protein N-lysine methyltransferase METTL21A
LPAQRFRRGLELEFNNTVPGTHRLSDTRSRTMAEERSPSPDFDPLAVGVDLAPLPEYKAAATAGFNFDGLLAKPLRLHEDLTSGCGGQTWPAGMVLAKHMLRYHQKGLRGSRM